MCHFNKDERKMIRTSSWKIEEQKQKKHTNTFKARKYLSTIRFRRTRAHLDVFVACDK